MIISASRTFARASANSQSWNSCASNACTSMRRSGCSVWNAELVERMERAGIAPTEKVFDRLKDELGDAIAARRSGANPAGGKRS